MFRISLAGSRFGEAAPRPAAVALSDSRCPVTSRVRAIVILLAGATLISSSPVFVKLAMGGALGPTAVGFWRTLVGGLILFAIGLARHGRLGLSRQALPFAVLAGLFFCADLYFWHRSIQNAGAGMATMLANTQVFATALISFFVFRERPSLMFYGAAAVAFVGVVLLVGVGSERVVFTASYVRGVVYGLLTAIAYANYIVSLKKGQAGRPGDHAVIFVAWTSLFCALFLGLVAATESDGFWPSNASEIGALLGLAVIVQALGWWTIASGLPRVPTAQAGLILLLQPTLAMVWGALFFAEYLTGVQVLGAVIALAGMYMGSIREQVRR